MSISRNAFRGVFKSSSLALGCLGLAALSLGACATQDYSYRAAQEIRENPTPDLDTLDQRRVDIDNMIAVTEDENGRMLNADWNRFWLLERPSRLAPDQLRR